jgi:predicted nucleotidyltransferase
MIEIIRDHFTGKKGIVALHLFGSAVRRPSNHVNDVDIAVLYEKRSVPDHFALANQQENLSSVIRKEADMIVMNEAPVVLRMQVFKKGIPVLIKDRKTLNRFMVATMNEYFDLKIVRRPIEQALHRVSIYG